jgi:hypothetical protein
MGDDEKCNILHQLKLKACGLEEIFIGSCKDVPNDGDIEYAIDACNVILEGIDKLRKAGIINCDD